MNNVCAQQVQASLPLYSLARYLHQVHRPLHLVGIHYTGTSVNPARSFGPALVEGGKALSELYVFIVGPFIGAAVAAALWKLVETEK